DLQGLRAFLRSQYTIDQIVALLTGPDDDGRKVAALALSLVGSKCCIKELSRQLQHPDPTANQMAEHALWSIWFRMSEPEANKELCRGAKAIGRREFDTAIAHCTRAIEIDPTFAEAYNQRAIAYYLLERYEDSVADCQRSVERMPCHFGAWAGMGHCHAHLGRLSEACESYQQAVEINPHLEGVRQLLIELRKKLNSN
ncbi:MAG TPA: tetratricopeptide repeat protein, partial [Tepidisphaeraceae bacterium]|nr:tetratricopeptide repeat protein [Tepidisphaeraceae bacterium]